MSLTREEDLTSWEYGGSSFEVEIGMGYKKLERKENKFVLQGYFKIEKRFREKASWLKVLEFQHWNVLYSLRKQINKSNTMLFSH